MASKKRPAKAAPMRRAEKAAKKPPAKAAPKRRAEKAATKRPAKAGPKRRAARTPAPKPAGGRFANIPGIAPDAQPLAPAKPPGDELRARARAIYDILSDAHADAHIALEFGGDPFRLLVMTILSAQCTDETVNRVAPVLFAKYPDAAALAVADPKDVQQIILPTGFFRQKTKSIVESSRAIVERHGGRVPEEMAALTALPGVGRKTANIVRGNAFGLPGLGVDTHVRRVSQRLELTHSDDPVQIEGDLCALWAPETWTMATHYLIFHGRRICHARAPRCPECVVQDLCPASVKFLKAAGRAAGSSDRASRAESARAERGAGRRKAR